MPTTSNGRASLIVEWRTHKTGSEDSPDCLAMWMRHAREKAAARVRVLLATPVSATHIQPNTDIHK